MSNTTVFTGRIIEISGLDGSTDWTLSDVGGEVAQLGWIYLQQVQFIGGAADDRLIIHDKSIDNVSVFDSAELSGDGNDPRVWEYVPYLQCTPVIDMSDCTFSAGTRANCKIRLIIA